MAPFKKNSLGCVALIVISMTFFNAGSVNFIESRGAMLAVDPATRILVKLATPDWGDGKNKDESILALGVAITANSGGRYVTSLVVNHNTEVPPGKILEIELPAAAGIDSVTFENLTTIELSIDFWKPDYNNTRTDKWNARAEAVVVFKSGRSFGTSTNDPAVELNFSHTPHTWVPFTPRPRKELFNGSQLVKEPVH